MTSYIDHTLPITRTHTNSSMSALLAFIHSFIHVTPVAEAQNEHRQPIPNAADHSKLTS
jgi:hypothetical protein